MTESFSRAIIVMNCRELCFWSPGDLHYMWECDFSEDFLKIRGVKIHKARLFRTHFSSISNIRSLLTGFEI